MTPPGREDHWLDRLAVRRTRREAVRGALAAAALTLPLGSSRALAANPNGSGPHDCQTGCLFMAHVEANNTMAGCRDAAGFAGGAGLSFTLLPLLSALVSSALISDAACQSAALRSQKAKSWDCLQPNCPGFDPNAAGGPCESCLQAGGKCCPYAGSPTGYGCCANDPNICCDSAQQCKTC